MYPTSRRPHFSVLLPKMLPCIRTSFSTLLSFNISLDDYSTSLIILIKRKFMPSPDSQRCFSYLSSRKDSNHGANSQELPRFSAPSTTHSATDSCRCPYRHCCRWSQSYLSRTRLQYCRRRCLDTSIELLAHAQCQDHEYKYRDWQGVHGCGSQEQHRSLQGGCLAWWCCFWSVWFWLDFMREKEWLSLILGLGNTNGGRFTTFAGGLPIVNSKGQVVGGVSLSLIRLQTLVDRS